MKRILPLLLAILLVLSGCSSNYEEGPGISWEEYQQSQSTSEETSSAEEETNYPSVFSMAYYKGHTLDPITCGEGIQQDVASLLYEPLVQLDENMEPEAALAVSCETSDNITWTITLREGVTFQSGAPMTAEAVKACLEQFF